MVCMAILGGVSWPMNIINWLDPSGEPISGIPPLLEKWVSRTSGTAGRVKPRLANGT